MRARDPEGLDHAVLLEPSNQSLRNGEGLYARDSRH